jgi:uncharacterized protein YdhG (YjbR/CyaY superfamily)
MARPGHETVDDYVQAQPERTRAVLERVRAAIRKALPGATEGISYQIPVYKLEGRMVLYFAGFRAHYSLYPATPRVVAALERELAGALHNKATIRFPLDEVPVRLITRIARLRAAEVTEGAAAKGARRPAAKRSPAKGKRSANAASRTAKARPAKGTRPSRTASSRRRGP